MRVRADDVACALRDAETTDTERVFTALRLVDHLCAWMPGATDLLEGPLRPLLSTGLTVTLPVKGQPKVFRLAAEAMTAYTALLWRVPMPPDATPAWLDAAAPDALRRALEQGHHPESLAAALAALCPKPLRARVGEVVWEVARQPTATPDLRRHAHTALEALKLGTLAAQVAGLLASP